MAYAEAMVMVHLSLSSRDRKNLPIFRICGQMWELDSAVWGRRVPPPTEKNTPRKFDFFTFERRRMKMRNNLLKTWTLHVVMNEGQRRTMTERSVINAAAVSVKTKFLQEKKF
jgi:hypothetical protein